jgi:biopolymer transport protein ExbD
MRFERPEPAEGTATLNLSGGDDPEPIAGLPTAGIMALLLVLLLLVSVALVQRARETRVPVTLPAAATSTPAREGHDTVAVSVDATGQIRLYGQPLSAPELQRRFRRLVEYSHDAPPRLVLRADASTPYTHVAEILAHAREAGIVAVDCLMQPPRTEAQP